MSTDTDRHAGPEHTPARVLGRITAPLYALDTDWRFSYVNESAAATFDCEPDALLGDPVWETLSDAAEPSVRVAFRDAIETGEPTRVRLHDGPRDALVTGLAYPGPDGLTVRLDAPGATPLSGPDAEALRRFHDITTDAERSVSERLTAVLDLGREYLGLDVGILAGVDGETYTVEVAVTPDDALGTGETFALGDTVCDRVVDRGAVVSFASAATAGSTHHPTDRERPVESYLGAPVVVDGEPYGTLSFSRSTPREEPFSWSEETFVRLLAQWAGEELGRRQHRARARATRDRLRQIIDMLPQLVFAKDETGEFLLANEAVADAYGTTVATLEGATDADFADSREEVAQFRAADRAVIESGEAKHVPEESLTTADGDRRILETTKIPYDPVDADGDAVLGVSTDITELKRREATLELQSAAMEASMDGISILGRDERYIYMNQAHADVFDYDATELDGHSWRDLYGDDEIERIEREVFPVLEREGKWRGETVGERRDGSPVHQELTLSLLDDGKLICTNRDITERTRREAELQTVRDRFQRFSRAVPSAFYLISADYAETHYVNAAAETLYGVSTDAFFEDPEAWTRHVHPADADAMRAELERQKTDDVAWPIEQEFRIRHPDRGLRWIRASIHPVENADGELAELAGVSTDVTERRQLQRSLRRSEEALRTLTAVASDTDRDFDAKLEAILELGCDRLDLAYGFLNRLDEHTQSVVEATGTHPLLQAGESVPLSQSYCRKTVKRDGVLDVADAVTEGWSGDAADEAFGLGCYIGGTVVVDGDTYGTLCFGADDSRTQGFGEAERAFVELLVQWVGYELESDAVETKLRQLNETAQRLMTAGDTDEIGAITAESANSVLDLGMTGVWWYDESAGALVPASMTDAAARLIDEQPTFEDGNSLAWQVFTDGKTRLYDDLYAMDGRHNEDTALRSEMIVPLGGHGVLISGSRQQRAFSETDRSLVEVLSATVEAALDRAERAQVLRETREQLAQSNQELEQFAYVASHDLQEPLRTISSYLTLLERRYRDDLSGDALEFVDFAVDGADRMREMIQALLEYSRVETRGEPFAATDMDSVLDRMLRNLELTVTEADATVDLPADAGTVLGDENQLVQLFQNLVDNAVKYSDGDPHVEVSARRRDGAIEYAVTDDGIGMDPGQLDGIFELFRRAHTREEFEGTGIGLSVCWKIVERHDGDIRVESTPGVGSTFLVTLPVAGDDSA